MALIVAVPRPVLFMRSSLTHADRCGNENKGDKAEGYATVDHTDRLARPICRDWRYVDEWADHNARSQARKQNHEDLAEGSNDRHDQLEDEQTKTADPVAKKMVARRRTL